MNVQPFTAIASRARSTGTTFRSLLSEAVLRAQNSLFRDSGGVSAKNRCYGFVPAFLDADTGAVYRARYADGRPAPMHLLDGLPEEVIAMHTVAGGVAAAKSSIIAGFLRDGRFYTREQAAAVVAG